jgi:hypothetical protein
MRFHASQMRKTGLTHSFCLPFSPTGLLKLKYVIAHLSGILLGASTKGGLHGENAE